MTGDARARVLVERWQTHRDAAARAELVRLYTPLLRNWARKYPGAGDRRDDAFQEAAIGMLVAIDRFDPTRGASFATYARLWIKARMLAFIKRTGPVQRLNTRESRRVFHQLGRHMRALEREGRSITAEGIAEVSGADVAVVQAVLAHAHRIDVELDAPASPGSRTSRIEQLPAELPPADELLDAAREADRARRAIALAMHTLDAREREIVQLRWFEEPRWSLRRIGAHIGLSGERVRQIECDALRKLAQRVGRASRRAA